ncbi:MAG: hypothetical protein ACFCVF_10305, partial [Kineosporiaceae bacterium]
DHLGVTTRAVDKWEARGAGITPRPELQRALDTALTSADPVVRARLLPWVEGSRHAVHAVDGAPPEVQPRAEAEPESSADSSAESPTVGGARVAGVSGRREPRTRGPGPSIRSPRARAPDVSLVDLGGVLDSSGRPAEADDGVADDEEDAFELVRRVAASDVGEETLLRLEATFDDLASAYSVTRPEELLPRVRRQLRFVGELIDAPTRKTLKEHRRLLVVGAWLSLLGGTLHVDLARPGEAGARLSTAAALARQAGHPELEAWTYETRAWQALTSGDYPKALDLSRAAQELAPRASSAGIQAMAQEGRAWARLGSRRETARVLRRVDAAVANLARPDRPEHHYRYDPDKATAYTATTLAWVGDPAAENHARDVITRLGAATDTHGWPRRVATAQVDLALALVAAGRLDEAAASALAGILSGRIVPSSHWRAAEVVHVITARDLPEAPDLRAAYEALRRGELSRPRKLERHPNDEIRTQNREPTPSPGRLRCRCPR